jgi:hypothetical protein
MERTKVMIVDDSKTVHAELSSILSELSWNGKNLDIEHTYGYEEFKKSLSPKNTRL